MLNGAGGGAPGAKQPGGALTAAGQTGPSNQLTLGAGPRNDEKDKVLRLKNLHDEFRQLFEVGGSDDDEDE